MAGKVRVAAIDCTENTATCQARLMFLPAIRHHHKVVSDGHSGTMFPLVARFSGTRPLLAESYNVWREQQPHVEVLWHKQWPLESECACIECDVLHALQEFGVSGYPTIKFFGENRRRPLEYSGGRDADAMASFVLAKWAALQPPPEVRELVGQHVLEDECLGDGQRPAKKLWCPPSPLRSCHRLCNLICTLSPAWQVLGDKCCGAVGRASAGPPSRLCAAAHLMFGSYVTFCNHTPYVASRMCEVAHLILYPTLPYPLTLRGLSTRSLVAFLPHILDSGAAGRQRHLGMLRDLAAKFRERPFGFLWAQGGAQPALERSLEVGGCAMYHLSLCCVGRLL